MTIALRMDGGIIRRPNVSDSSLAFSEHWYLVVLFPLALEAFPTLSHTLYTVSLRLLCALLSFLWIVMYSLRFTAVSLYILINIWCCISHCKKVSALPDRCISVVQHFLFKMVVDSIPGNFLLSTTKYFTTTTHCMIVLITKPRGMFGLCKTILLLICVRSHSSDVE